MFTCETQILQRLAVLVVCHGIAVGQITSHYFIVQRPMSWSEAREFCLRHYVDLAVLGTEQQYFTLLNATLANRVSLWLGLQRKTIFSSWTWVNGEELKYQHWYRWNYEGHCASLESMMERNEKMLARYCDESHMFVCQGPVSPQPVMADSVGVDQINLSWNVSAYMQMTSHNYSVTMCSSTCKTHIYPYAEGSASMNINISNLTSATEYLIKIAAFVVRPENNTGENTILQSKTTVLQVKTADCCAHNVITIILKWLKLIYVAIPFWTLYCILKKGGDADNDCESSHEVSSVKLSEDTVINLDQEKTRRIG